MSRSAALALGLVALLAAARAAAQGTQPPADCPEGQTVINFASAELDKDVIPLIARFTGKNFLFDERVRGSVVLLSPTCVTQDEAFRVFESILQVKGFTLVEGPAGVLKIVPVRDAKESPIETVPGAERVPNRDLYITRLIPLRYIKADAIANALRPLVSKDANMVEYLPTNTIILTDSASNVRRLLTIIEQIDVSTYQEQIKVIPIQYADAATLAEQLAEIFGAQVSGTGGGARPGAIPRAARRAQAVGQQPQPDSAALGEAGQPRFITDERTNSIIVIAPTTTIERVQRTVTLLDYKRPGTGRIHVYRLQNADAEEMAETLASLASGGGAPRPTGGVGGLGAAVGVGGAAAGGAASAVAAFEDGARITADAPTNSLIIQASSEGYAAIRDVIEQLDTRRPQVMVEALIMEITVNQSSALGGGFLYQNLLFNDDEGSRLVLGSNTGAALFDPNNPLGAFGDPGEFVSAILGKTISVDTDGDGTADTQLPVIQGVITARASDSDANVISAPVILTADNEEAQIIVGQEIPVPTTRLQTADPTAGANAFQTSSNIERQDVGVTLRVTPQISEGDLVRLEIFQEISSLIAATPAELLQNLGPRTNKRSVENKAVFVQDGEAVMIGGIIQDSLNKGETKVPFLGDIPILGWAFKSINDQIDKTNLLVILTPHIVRDPEDLRRLTVENREEFRGSGAGALQLSQRELEERKRALRAGIDLPLDENPVRRELEKHETKYPVEQLPDLRQQRGEREKERLEQLRREEAAGGGDWAVQVAIFRDANDAVALLGRLAQQGYDGTVLSRVEQDEAVHYVQLGPYPSLDRAQQIEREVAAATGLATAVVVLP
jgi:general secretion pathway protein D